VTKRWVLALIGVGLALRFGISFGVFHHSYDLDSVTIVDHVMRTDPLTLYDTGRYPYPPGFVPWIVLARSLADLSSHITFATWVELPSIAADAVLAYVVASHLAWRGVSSRLQLIGAATVALGPTFVILSGYEVQVDSVAILPAVLALVVWERRPDWIHRGLVVGLLLGTAGALKTSPLLLLAAFLPTARSWRERATIVGAGVAVPLLVVAPWLVADFDRTVKLLRYSGLPGVGGLSLVTQPSLARAVILGANVRPGSLATSFLDHGVFVLAPFYALVAVALWKWRVEANVACAVVWLTFYAFAPNFFFQYLIWGIPFFLLAGYVVPAALFVAFIAIPHLVFVARPWRQSAVATLYEVLVIGAWVGYVVALALLLTRLRRRARFRSAH
jgi:hypothetical protein